jgi:GTP-binding protein
LFDKLGATDEQLDFPVIYASALNGYASNDADVTEGDLTPLFEALVEYVPPPPVDLRTVRSRCRFRPCRIRPTSV